MDQQSQRYSIATFNGKPEGRFKTQKEAEAHAEKLYEQDGFTRFVVPYEGRTKKQPGDW